MNTNMIVADIDIDDLDRLDFKGTVSRDRALTRDWT
jgi:hypothetical protein